VILLWHGGNGLPFLTEVTSKVNGGEGVSVSDVWTDGFTSNTDNVSAADNGEKTSQATSPHRQSTAWLKEIILLIRPAAVSNVYCIRTACPHSVLHTAVTVLVFTARYGLISCSYSLTPGLSGSSPVSLRFIPTPNIDPLTGYHISSWFFSMPSLPSTSSLIQSSLTSSVTYTQRC
jgi:hypothetical protein